MKTKTKIMKMKSVHISTRYSDTTDSRTNQLADRVRSQFDSTDRARNSKETDGSTESITRLPPAERDHPKETFKEWYRI